MKRVAISFGITGTDLVLLTVMRRQEAWAEWYGNTIYPIWVKTLGRLCALFPGSVVEWLLYAVCLVAIIWFFRFLRIVYKKQPGAGRYFRRGMERALLFAAGLFTLYTLTCGINYYKISFAETYGFEKEAYTTEELREVCDILTARIRELSAEVARDGAGEMVVSEDADQMAVHTMQKLGETYPKLSGFYPVPKGLAGSWLLSVQGLTGVYSPFTVEANYNDDMTGYNKPFTMCHELAHLKGFMQEEEANMIGFLACEQSDDPAFRYSSAMMGWIYCGNELYRRDSESYREAAEALPETARVDLDANSAFWDAHEGIISEASEKVNDTYLKANRQEAGVDSYDRVVDLIVQYLKENGRRE